jgi:hypothetical protein
LLETDLNGGDKAREPNKNRGGDVGKIITYLDLPNQK